MFAQIDGLRCVFRDHDTNPGSIDPIPLCLCTRSLHTWQQHQREEPEAEHDLVNEQEDDSVFEGGLHLEPEKHHGSGAVFVFVRVWIWSILEPN